LPLVQHVKVEEHAVLFHLDHDRQHILLEHEHAAHVVRIDQRVGRHNQIADDLNIFVDLTLTSSSVATGGNGTLALPGRRLSELALPRAQGDPQVQVGSNLSFVYSLLNNGPGPAPQVTVASNLPSTLSYLSCSTSTGLAM